MIEVLENDGKFGAICICETCRKKYKVKNKYDSNKSWLGGVCKSCKEAVSTMGEISKEKLQQSFYYDPDTGEIRHKNNTVSGQRHAIATYDHSGGYLCISINRKSQLAHRMIFMYMTGRLPNIIDHKDHNRTNNKWSNIREVNYLDNAKNASLSKNSSTKINGVSFHKQTGRYRAYIMVNRKQIHLGMFDCKYEAEKARSVADRELNFHNNHGH